MRNWPESSMASSPLIEGDRMWFCTNRAEIVCLDIGPLKQGAGDPRIVWKIDLIEEFGVYPFGAIMNFQRRSSVASDKNRLFVITGNGVDLSSPVTIDGVRGWSAPSPR